MTDSRTRTSYWRFDRRRVGFGRAFAPSSASSTSIESDSDGPEETFEGSVSTSQRPSPPAGSFPSSPTAMSKRTTPSRMVSTADRIHASPGGLASSPLTTFATLISRRISASPKKFGSVCGT